MMMSSNSIAGCAFNLLSLLDFLTGKTIFNFGEMNLGKVVLNSLYGLFGS